LKHVGKLMNAHTLSQQHPPAVDHIFPNFRPIGWAWNGEVHYFMSDQPQADTTQYPNPGELLDAALDAPPPEPAE
jgi:hypothetical protein